MRGAPHRKFSWLKSLIAMERRWLSRVHGDEFLGRLTEIAD